MTDKNKKSRLTLRQARQGLGMIARNYSDDEMQEVMDAMRAIAELAYEDGDNEDASGSAE